MNKDLKETEILKVGNIHYLKKIDKNVKAESYEPVTKEYWKMLRDMDPGKFGLTYDEYIKLKERQFETEVNRRKNCELEMFVFTYNLHQPNETKKRINEILSDEFFDRWMTKKEIIEYILNYE